MFTLVCFEFHFLSFEESRWSMKEFSSRKERKWKK